MDKKQLKEAYKQYRPEMGVYAIENAEQGICYLEAAADLKASMNGARFKLDGGMHKDRALQDAWKQSGGDGFQLAVLEVLPYDEKDAGKTDYTEELALLKAIWEEKIQK